MRIISGRYKGRRFQAPKNLPTRPTTDFAKESLFNILQNEIDFSETIALDLFSGIGGISFELVSRGCPKVVSVDQNFKCIRHINDLKEKLQAIELHPIKSNAFTYIENCSECFDLIFADPPYDMEGIMEIPDKILTNQLLDEGGIFILEHSNKQSFEQHPKFRKHKNYGSVNFSFFQH